MTLKSRVALIVSGFLIFLVLAPAIVLTAQGYYFDFENYQLVRTGTLTVKTDPRGAIVTANGSRLGDTPLAKRFFLPGEYRVEVDKPGYQPWRKFIAVNEQRVASLPRGTEKIFLVLLNPEVKSAVATTTSTLLSPTEQNSESLYFISPEDRRLMAKNTDGTATPILEDPLPKANKEKIVSTPQKQIFLLLDDTLFQVTETLLEINHGVTYAAWDPEAEALVYSGAYEIWLYRPLAQSGNELITRLAGGINSPVIFRSQIGYFFFASGNKIVALEYDPQGQPNQYLLVETKTENPQFSVNSDGDELTYLDAGELVTLKI